MGSYFILITFLFFNYKAKKMSNYINRTNVTSRDTTYLICLRAKPLKRQKNLSLFLITLYTLTCVIANIFLNPICDSYFKLKNYKYSKL